MFKRLYGALVHGQSDARQDIEISFRKFSLLMLLASLVAAVPAGAQSMDSLAPILPDVAVHDIGWSQLWNLREMMDFGLALVEVGVLTFAIAYHPVSLAMRRSKADYELPRTLFVYAMIGLTVGFLVMHHGYLIGFVIFGIGGFLRFKNETVDPAHTTRQLLTTLVGLCVGLDLPVIAFLATACVWIIVYFFSAHARFALEVRFGEKKAPVQSSIDKLGALLRERGFSTLSVTKGKFKPAAAFVLEGAKGTRREVLMREVSDIQAQKLVPIEDWHIE